MGSRRRRRKTAQIAGNHDEGAPSSVRSSALEENVQAIKRWEKTILLARSKAEQVSDWIACTAGSGPVLVLHVVWFGAWVTVNAGAVRGIRPLLQDIAKHLAVHDQRDAGAACEDLMKKIDVRRLTRSVGGIGGAGARMGTNC